MNQITIVVGTRPNFIKVTRFKEVIEKYEDLSLEIIHTGQHYDDKMANVFFDQFELRPDVFLDIEPGHPGKQIGDMIISLTNHFQKSRPDLLIVVGDVNSTLAATIAGNKSGIPVAHLESGLRSFDDTMPEEHNRLVADSLSTLFFVTEDSGLRHLEAEQKGGEGVAFVGNTMIDTLVKFTPKIDGSSVLSDLGVSENEFALVTIHRPSNVDSREGLEVLLTLLEEVSKNQSLVFPMHPRTRKMIAELNYDERLERIGNLKIVGPMGYFDFQKLVKSCRFVLTDSGGIQEETTFLQKPCLTLRPNTERPSTIEIGSNVLLPFELDKILPIVDTIYDGTFKKGEIPALWDGKATERIVKRMESFFNFGY